MGSPTGEPLTNKRRLDIVILGLSITSSWGNGHATTYRSLVKALARRGHKVLFLEQDVPWYSDHRDVLQPVGARLILYRDLNDLANRFTSDVRNADLAIIGSYTRNGIAVGQWLLNETRGVTAFYDIDTPVTIAGLDRRLVDYISPELVRSYSMYLSFTGGPILDRLRAEYGARMVGTLYCSADPDLYYPEASPNNWDLGYMGTYSQDRANAFNQLLLEPARRWRNGRMMVAGAMYPKRMRWPSNVNHVEHVAPHEHRRFYVSQRFTLNLTRKPMLKAGYSPSVRLFEAAACATPIITDKWSGLEEFFEPGKEILVADSRDDMLEYIRALPERHRAAIGERARRRVLAQHTAMHRAQQLERYVFELGRQS